MVVKYSGYSLVNITDTQSLQTPLGLNCDYEQSEFSSGGDE